MATLGYSVSGCRFDHPIWLSFAALQPSEEKSRLSGPLVIKVRLPAICGPVSFAVLRPF